MDMLELPLVRLVHGVFGSLVEIMADVDVILWMEIVELVQETDGLVRVVAVKSDYDWWHSVVS